MKPILLYVATRWPWPVSSGRMGMIDQALRMAADTHEVYLCYVGKEEPGPMPPHVASATLLRSPGALDVAINLLRGGFDRPLQDALFSSRDGRRAFAALVGRLRPDVVLVDMLRNLQYVEGARGSLATARVVLDMDDRLSLRYRRMLDGGASGVLGDFAAKVPAPVRAACGILPGLLLGLEARRVGRRELAAPGSVDHVLLVSLIEASSLAAAARAANVSAFPPAVEARPFTPRDFRRGVRAVFLGPDSYAPNREALMELDRVAGELAGVAGLTFEHAGRMSGNLDLRHVRQLGFVEDLDTFLGPDAVMVAPILTGTGIKTKLIEAMARGVPVITTAVGAEGLGCVPGRDLIVSETDGMADSVPRPGDARAQAEMASLAASGHAHVSRFHDPEEVKRILVSALGGREPRPPLAFPSGDGPRMLSAVG